MTEDLSRGIDVVKSGRPGSERWTMSHFASKDHMIETLLAEIEKRDGALEQYETLVEAAEDWMSDMNEAEYGHHPEWQRLSEALKSIRKIMGGKERGE